MYDCEVAINLCDPQSTEYALYNDGDECNESEPF